MDSKYVVDTTVAAGFHFWSSAQPMTHLSQALWPCFPLTLPYELAAPGPPYLANNYAGVVSSQVIPCFYNTVIGNPKPNECRKFFLDRCLFDLVAAHPYLALTDPKLLSWYLSLSPEDRKIIQDEGGFQLFLQRHPGLELSKHHVYVKSNSDNGALQPAVMSNNHTAVTPTPRMCSSDLELEMLTDNVKVTTLHCTSRRNGSEKLPHEEIYQTRQHVHLQDGFQRAHSPIKQKEEDPASLVSFSLDMELERCRRRGKPEHRNQMLVTQDQTANFICAEVSPLQSEWSTIDKTSSDYYSFDYSIQMDGTEYNDSITVQSTEPEQLNCPLDPENRTKEQGRNDMVYGNEDTVDEDDDKSNLSLEKQSDNFYSIMEEDEGILVCGDSDCQKSHSSSSDMMESDQSDFKRNTEERSTSPVSCPPTCDVMVGTEPELYVSAFTQTEDPKTVDKDVATEVYMADLDYLAVRFLKLKMAQEKLKEKEKIRSSGCKLRSECDCVQRAQRAELSLLTLQYSMCRQHCWILYCTTAGGDQLNPVSGDTNQYWLKEPPADILSVLQKLESDYNELREKILKGVPLEKLKPLSVDSEKMTTAATYIPAQIIANMHRSVLSRCPQELHTHGTSGDENGCPNNENTNGCQGKTKEVKENSYAKRAATLVPQGRSAIHDARKLAESQTTAYKEHTTSESWYDAEENLEPAEPAAAPEMGQNRSVHSDAMLSFEKYSGSEVSISASDNDLSGPQPAEAVVRELKGSSMKGHTAHVEHMKRAVGGRQRQASTSISGSKSSQDATKPQTVKANSNGTERKLTTQPPPLGSIIKNRQMVCISPTTKGTCVPQHYGTMGSFDTLMAELSQRHPDVGRQRIVDALVELRAKHHGVLSGLPLRSIMVMASELLTRPVSATRL